MTQTTAGCWVLRHPDGHDYDTGDGVPHYDTEAEANADARDLAEKGDALTATQLAGAGCVTVTCPVCTGELDCDAFAAQHFTTAEEARKGALDADWVEGPDGRLYCGEDCALTAEEAS